MGVTYIDAPSAALSEEAEKALQSIRDRPNWHPLLNRSVDVTQGPFKGYRGRVKSVNELDSSAQVEFEALLSKRTIRLALDCLRLTQGRHIERQSSENVREPEFEREHTPMPEFSSSYLFTFNDAFDVGPVAPNPPPQTYSSVSETGISLPVY